MLVNGICQMSFKLNYWIIMLFHYMIHIMIFGLLHREMNVTELDMTLNFDLHFSTIKVRNIMPFQSLAFNVYGNM